MLASRSDTNPRGESGVSQAQLATELARCATCLPQPNAGTASESAVILHKAATIELRRLFGAATGVVLPGFPCATNRALCSLFCKQLRCLHQPACRELRSAASGAAMVPFNQSAIADWHRCFFCEATLMCRS